jgi:hypothetical protein
MVIIDKVEETPNDYILKIKNGDNTIYIMLPKEDSKWISDCWNNEELEPFGLNCVTRGHYH